MGSLEDASGGFSQVVSQSVTVQIGANDGSMCTSLLLYVKIAYSSLISTASPVVSVGLRLLVCFTWSIEERLIQRLVQSELLIAAVCAEVRSK